jgi:hypothetical protein
MSTLQDVISAIRKNGYTKAKGAYINYKGETNKILSACALGQGSLNLGIPAGRLDRALGKIWGEKSGINLSSVIVYKNDESDMTIPEIADVAEQWLIENEIPLDTPIFV